MARVQPGGGVVDINGSMAGNTFARNKGGLYMRKRVTPINPNSTAQSLQRNYQSTIAKRWASVLSDDQRSAWKNYGVQLGTIGAFGDRLILSGIATYMKINRMILNAGAAIIDSPPTSLDIQGLTSLVLTANHTGPVLSVAFDPSPYAGTQGLYIFGTPAMSPGISNFSSKLRFIGFFAAATTPLDISTAWTTKFGAFPGVAGQRIGITVQGFDTSTGAVAPAASTGAIIS